MGDTSESSSTNLRLCIEGDVPKDLCLTIHFGPQHPKLNPQVRKHPSADPLAYLDKTGIETSSNNQTSQLGARISKAEKRSDEAHSSQHEAEALDEKRNEQSSENGVLLNTAIPRSVCEFIQDGWNRYCFEMAGVYIVVAILLIRFAAWEESRKGK
ncbi:hypothetical protein BJ508DRAFT_375348 [Ascobolus immersus RN42]|uniref:Uncharacterized protein n=1 Tax=Ascobolus immersus RN42 TaxID=1160509 RepID=A0A3N4IMK1_ASCIM|nr:hypothetical protein BJ508DRAFT_375348 [Ascobolus immersus RN42]